MKRTVILSIIAIVVLVFLCGPYAGLAIPVLLLAYFYMKYHKEREESPDAERMDMLTTVDEVTAKYGEPDDVIVTNARHYESLTLAHESLLRVIDGLHHQLSGDLLSEDLRLTLNHLADITGGQITPQETLNQIFSTFCIGK